MRLAAEDPETDRILFEVRTLLRPQSALSEPRLASRFQAMMATTQAARPAFRLGQPSAGGLDSSRSEQAVERSPPSAGNFQPKSWTPKHIR